jgi:hypothetical protein
MRRTDKSVHLLGRRGIVLFGVPPLVRTQMALVRTQVPLLRTQVPLVRTQMALVRTQMVIVRTQTALERCTSRSSVSLLHLKRGTSKDAVLQNIFFILNKRAGRFLQNKS